LSEGEIDLARVREAFKYSRPRNSTELYHYTRAFLRNEYGEPIRLGHTAVCKGHASPFEFFRDAFFNLHRLQIVHAGRGTGKTMIASVLTQMEQWFDGFIRGKVPYRSLIAGAVERQAKDAMAIAGSIWNQREYLEAFYSKDGSVGIHKTDIKTSDGSKTSTTVATMKGMNSPHVPKVTFDELDLWDPYILKQGKSIAKAARGHPRAIRMLSTMKYATGIMADAIDNAASRGYKPYTWCIFEAMEACPRERECDRCPLYQWNDKEGGELCGGRAKHSTGHYPIDEVIEIYQDLDRETFESEWLCKRPDRKGLVYGRHWRPEVHRFNSPISYNNMLPLVLTIDQGWTNPFAVLYMQEDTVNDRLRVIGEEYQTHVMASDMGKRVAERLFRWGVPTGVPLDIIFDAEDPSGAHEFAKNLIYGNHRYRARLKHPGRIDVLHDLRYCRQRLKDNPNGVPRMIIGSDCINFCREFDLYRYPTKSATDRPTTEKPAKNNDHAMDAWRRFETIRAHRARASLSGAADPRRN
jgi:hypothetical protein